jgi:hypothetical protein
MKYAEHTPISEGAKRETSTSLDRPKAVGTLHIYTYDYIYDNKDGNNEWNRPRPL